MDVVKKLAVRSRKRFLARMLGNLEARPWWDGLPDAEREEVRVAVFDAVNAYHEVMLDVLAVTDDDDGMIRSDLAVEAIARLHDLADRVERALNGDT